MTVQSIYNLNVSNIIQYSYSDPKPHDTDLELVNGHLWA